MRAIAMVLIGWATYMALAIGRDQYHEWKDSKLPTMSAAELNANFSHLYSK